MAFIYKDAPPFLSFSIPLVTMLTGLSQWQLCREGLVTKLNVLLLFNSVI